ncbi:uncharacterized protein LOC121583437 [Coregonus clupeaformis]|uniref:uncharacterized protein LOC121583437 n=1 Tax=Coregonus clupeaformis TaxID=59861 RepID=UPI001E1C455D|nr:uncharacterized protein LOC121583437 [Coregonus clupeaformis]
MKCEFDKIPVKMAKYIAEISKVIHWSDENTPNNELIKRLQLCCYQQERSPLVFVLSSWVSAGILSHGLRGTIERWLSIPTTMRTNVLDERFPMDVTAGMLLSRLHFDGRIRVQVSFSGQLLSLTPGGSNKPAHTTAPSASDQTKSYFPCKTSVISGQPSRGSFESLINLTVELWIWIQINCEVPVNQTWLTGLPSCLCHLHER